MGDAFDGVRLAVGEVVVGVGTASPVGLMVVGVADTVHDRILQVHVQRGHVDLGARNLRGRRRIRRRACEVEPVQVLFPPGRSRNGLFTWLSQRAPPWPAPGQVVHIGLARPWNQLDGPVRQLVEILGGIAHFTPDHSKKPSHLKYGTGGVDVFLVFLGRVGVVETQVRDATELLGPGRSSHRSTWRIGRCANSRWARVGKRVTICVRPESGPPGMIGRRK